MVDALGEMTQETKWGVEANGTFVSLGWAAAEFPRIAVWGIDPLRDFGCIDWGFGAAAGIDLRNIAP